MKYKTIQKNIKGIARKMEKRTGIPFHDFIAEGNLAYVQCLKYYDAKKGNFQQYANTAIYREMKKYANKFTVQSIEYNDELMSSNKYTPEDYANFRLNIENLSKQSKKIVNLIFDCPVDLFKLCENNYNTKLSKRILKKYLLKKHWPHKTINFCFQEIKEALL